MIRKSQVKYKIVYDYVSYQKQYDDILLQTTDRKQAAAYFLELKKRIQEGKVVPASDCAVRLRVEINYLISESINLIDILDEADLDHKMEKIEHKLTLSYDNFKYSIKLGCGTGALPYSKCKILIETEDRGEAFDKFIELLHQKQQAVVNKENETDIVFEAAISPYDVGCMYLKYLNTEEEIINKLQKIESIAYGNFDK